MAQVTVHHEDAETVVLRIADSEFIGIAYDAFDEEFEDRGLKGGAVTVAELTLRPEVAREVLRALVGEAKF